MKDWIMELCPQIAEWQAKLIVQHVQYKVDAEREACAKVCEENANDLSEGDWDSACINCADHIRARGNNETQTLQDAVRNP